MSYRSLTSCSVVCQYFDTWRIGFEKENLITGYSEDLSCRMPHWFGGVLVWMSSLFARGVCGFFPPVLIFCCAFVFAVRLSCFHFPHFSSVCPLSLWGLCAFWVWVLIFSSASSQSFLVHFLALLSCCSEVWVFSPVFWTLLTRLHTLQAARFTGGSPLFICAL